MDTKKHYQTLREERERRLEEYYGKRAFSCVHTLSGQRCPQFKKFGDCDVIYIDHMHTREYAIIGEPYSLTRDELERIFNICDQYRLSVDISAELSTHNIGCTLLIALKPYCPTYAWGYKQMLRKQEKDT